MTTAWWQLGWVWAGTGWALLALGAWVLLRALFRDRARGRKRCPGCWYDMSGARPMREGAAAWVCPECGRRIDGERSLKRTRRYWWRAGFAVVLMVLGYASLQFLAVRDGGWVRAVPMTALAYAAPTDQSGRGMSFMPAGVTVSGRAVPGFTPTPLPWREQLGDEAWRRVLGGQAWRWQSQRFVERALADGRINLDGLVLAPPRWPAGERIPVLVIQPVRPVLDELRFSKRWPSGVLASAPYPDLDEVAGGEAGRVRQIEVQLLLSVPRKEVYSLPVRREVQMVVDAAAIFRADASTETTERVREAFDVRLCMPPQGAVSLVLDNRSDSAVWNALQLGMGSVLTVRVGEEVAARGAHWPEWSRPVFKDWDEVPLAWEAGMRERVRAEPERVSVEVRGDVAESFRVYRAWPFADVDPACWTGTFRVSPPRIVIRPERVRDLDR